MGIYRNMVKSRIYFDTKPRNEQRFYTTQKKKTEKKNDRIKVIKV